MLSGFPVYLANKELQQVIVRGLGNKVREFLNSLVVSQLLRLPVFCGSQRPFKKPNNMPLNFWAPTTVTSPTPLEFGVGMVPFSPWDKLLSYKIPLNPSHNSLH
jgi:hypothetical protein